MKIIYFLNTLLCLTLFSCVSSVENSVELNESIEEHSEYRKILQDKMRTAKVIANFENKYQIWVTHIDETLYGAIQSRYKTLYHKSTGKVLTSLAPGMLFVSLFSPDEDFQKLKEPDIWTIIDRNSNQVVSPDKIKKVIDSDIYRPFFESVQTWTKEYIIDLNVSTPTSLTFAHASGKVSFEW